MANLIVILLILFSFVASISYSIKGMVRPESITVYNQANMHRAGIQVLSALLGLSGALELVLLQVPIFMIFRGYPSSALEWIRDQIF